MLNRNLYWTLFHCSLWVVISKQLHFTDQIESTPIQSNSPDYACSLLQNILIDAVESLSEVTEYFSRIFTQLGFWIFVHSKCNAVGVKGISTNPCWLWHMIPFIVIPNETFHINPVGIVIGRKCWISKWLFFLELVQFYLLLRILETYQFPINQNRYRISAKYLTSLRI